MTRLSRRGFGLGLGALALGGAVPVEAAPRRLRLKLGTLAPSGSAWTLVLRRMGQRWAEASGGRLALKIFPGGVAGDEGDMVRKMRIGQLQAGTLTGMGLAKITRSTVALQIPMMFDSWESLDRVRDAVGPRLEAELLEAGFVLLSWGDAGWVHKFSTTPAVTPDDFRSRKLFVRAGDPDAAALWAEAGFRPVPLASTDVLTGLRTGMIDAFGTTPLFALSAQWFGLAPHMLRIPWSPLNGGTVVTRAAWEKIDPGLRPRLLEIAREEGRLMRDQIRGLNDKAVEAMQARGLRVVEPSAEVLEAWRALARGTWGRIRGPIVPADLFDEVARLAAVSTGSTASAVGEGVR